ncbi:MAG: penicillin-binding protein 2 [Gammaproteobacteria bacterium]
MERDYIKDQHFESRLFMGRTVAAVTVIGLLLLVLVGRLIYLQVISHDLFTTLSQNNRVKIEPIAPTRGLIYDRKRRVLAENISSFSLEVTPERVPDLEKTLRELGEILAISEEDRERFQRLLRRKRRFEPVPLRLRLNESEVARFAINRHRFPGVEVRAGLIRHYPYGELMAHAVGYVGRIDEEELNRLDNANYSATRYIGKTGIERSYEEHLHGYVGSQKVETNAEGRVLRVLERDPPLPGNDLQLNLDVSLQQTAMEALGEHTGAVVAIEVTTGAVVALVSKPGFDPNPFVTGIATKEYRQLRERNDRPLFNRALSGQYPPGSTIKPFLGLGALERGLPHAGRRSFCIGYYQLEGDERKYRDWKKEGHGPVDLSAAIVQSCDVFFYELALEMGIDRIHDYLSGFGFGERSGIDLLGEAAGLMPSRAWKRRTRNLPWFPGETLITGIGQGFTLTTPLQLASATATLAARGRRLEPRLVQGLVATGSEHPLSLEPEERRPVPVSNAANWDYIIKAMERVVHGPRGTARRIAQDAPYHIAGKTGTAQVFGIKQDEEYEAEEIEHQLRDHALFIAFAPVESPKIAVAVVAEHGGSGGAVAAPIARRVMDSYFEEVAKP